MGAADLLDGAHAGQRVAVGERPGAQMNFAALPCGRGRAAGSACPCRRRCFRRVRRAAAAAAAGAAAARGPVLPAALPPVPVAGRATGAGGPRGARRARPCRWCRRFPTVPAVPVVPAAPVASRAARRAGRSGGARAPGRTGAARVPAAPALPPLPVSPDPPAQPWARRRDRKAATRASNPKRSNFKRSDCPERAAGVNSIGRQPRHRAIVDRAEQRRSPTAPPTRPSSMSHCASHGSPCDPRNACPTSDAKM